MGIETAFMAVSSVASAAGQAAAGRAQAQAHEYNAQVNERNAKVAEQEGKVLVRNEEVRILEFEEDIQDLLDAQAQAFRYNGVVASSGTALKVRMESAAEADEEIAMRRYNAAVGKTQAEESATQQRMQANLNRMYAKQARIAGMFGAGQSLLGGFSKIAKLG